MNYQELQDKFLSWKESAYLKEHFPLGNWNYPVWLAVIILDLLFLIGLYYLFKWIFEIEKADNELKLLLILVLIVLGILIGWGLLIWI